MPEIVPEPDGYLVEIQEAARGIVNRYGEPYEHPDGMCLCVIEDVAPPDVAEIFPPFARSLLDHEGEGVDEFGSTYMCMLIGSKDDDEIVAGFNRTQYFSFNTKICTSVYCFLQSDTMHWESSIVVNGECRLIARQTGKISADAALDLSIALHQLWVPGAE